MHHGTGLSPEFDPAVMAEIRALGGDELVDELVALSRHEVAGQHDALRRALLTEDAPALRRAAHAIGGSSATIGCLRVTETAGAIEQLAATGDVHGAEILVAELGRRWDEACLVLDQQATAPAPSAPGSAAFISDGTKGSS